MCLFELPYSYVPYHRPEPDVVVQAMLTLAQSGLTVKDFSHLMTPGDLQPVHSGRCDVISSGEWTHGTPDPKKDLTVALKSLQPIHRKPFLDGLDPERKVWSKKERREILNAPLPELPPKFELLLTPSQKIKWDELWRKLEGKK